MQRAKATRFTIANIRRKRGWEARWSGCGSVTHRETGGASSRRCGFRKALIPVFSPPGCVRPGGGEETVEGEDESDQGRNQPDHPDRLLAGFEDVEEDGDSEPDSGGDQATQPQAVGPPLLPPGLFLLHERLDGARPLVGLLEHLSVGFMAVKRLALLAPAFRPGSHADEDQDRGDRDEARFSTWLFAVAINVYRSQMRRIPPLEVPLEGARRRERTDPGASPEGQAVASERAEAVRRTVCRLPEKYRDAVILFYFCELDVTQAANCLQMAEGTFTSRLHRARKLLASRLASTGLAPRAEEAR